MCSHVLGEICTKGPTLPVKLGDGFFGRLWAFRRWCSGPGVDMLIYPNFLWHPLSTSRESWEHGQSGPGLQLSTRMLQSSYGKVVWFSYEEKKIKAFFSFIWKKGQVDNLRILKVFSQRMFPSLLEIWTNRFLIFDGTLQFINTFYFCHMIISFSPQFPLMVS